MNITAYDILNGRVKFVKSTIAVSATSGTGAYDTSLQGIGNDIQALNTALTTKGHYETEGIEMIETLNATSDIYLYALVELKTL